MSAVRLGSWSAGSVEWHEQRAGAVGGSDIAAILGLSPWTSRFSLYHERKGLIPHQAEKPEMTWGKRLEPVIVQAYAETVLPPSRSLIYERDTVYAHSERPWQVCSPDALIVNDDTEIVAGLEAKSDRFADEWGPSGSDIIPPYYRCQVLWCLDIFGLPSWDVAFLCSGSDFRTYTIHANADDQALMRDAARDFLDSLGENRRPSIDEHSATYEAVRKLHPSIADAEVELPREIALDYLAACSQHERASAELTRAKSALLDAMGDAKHATYAGSPIARRQPGRGTSVSLYPVKTKDAAA